MTRDPINHGSGELNHTEFMEGGPNAVLTKHCRPGTPNTYAISGEGGVDISYTKDFADFNHPNLF